MQLQCKSNNIGVMNRMTILFEFTSPGGVLPLTLTLIYIARRGATLTRTLI